MFPGMKLAEDTLGSIFKVSRTRIRKTLYRLEHHGIIVMESNRGAFVAKPTAEEARNVFQSRRIVETGIVRKLCQSISSAQIKGLIKHMETEQQALLKQERGAVIRLSGEFHIEIARCLNNDVITNFLSQLVSKTSLILSVFERPGTNVCTIDEHQDLLDLIMTGDSEKAESQMEAHLKHVEDCLFLNRNDQSGITLTDVFQDILSKS